MYDGAGDSSLGKSTCYHCKGSGLPPQHPPGASHLVVTTAGGHVESVLFWPLLVPDMHMVHINTQRKNTSTN